MNMSENPEFQKMIAAQQADKGDPKPQEKQSSGEVAREPKFLNAENLQDTSKETGHLKKAIKKVRKPGWDGVGRPGESTFEKPKKKLLQGEGVLRPFKKHLPKK
ncbi:MAG TPA: hypothetical protein VE973_00525 [Candidatus Limnocylindria bacterium]|nr:hypothetical protein [Candidatus Limnocylindria bacterium]